MEDGELFDSHFALLPEAKRFPPEPANSQPKLLFSQWFDTWRTRNEGVRQ
jgi:hypothetical protein